MKVLTYTITSITARPIRINAMLVISTFITTVILYVTWISLLEVVEIYADWNVLETIVYFIFCPFLNPSFIIFFFRSQSTEDSDPLYDQPLRYRHHSDSEPERPSSTSPPPFRTDLSGEYPQNGEHLVKPSVIKRRSNTNAGLYLRIILFTSIY